MKGRHAGNNWFRLNPPAEGQRNFAALGNVALGTRRFTDSISSAPPPALSEVERGREKKRGQELSAVGGGL